MPVQCTCLTCGAIFTVPPSRSNAKFCSLRCNGYGQGKETKPCEHCGAPFTAPIVRQRKTCSKTCRDAVRPRGRQMHEYICLVCGASFTAFSRKRKACSKACQFKLMAEGNTIPEAHLTAICQTCGSTFEHGRWKPAGYCSNRCRGKATIGNIARFKPTAIEATCEQCGTSMKVWPGTTRGRFCSLRCYGDWQSESGELSGPNSPFWNGGHTGYYGPSWRAARRAVRQRDRVCVDCGKPPEENGTALDVHHLVPFKTFGVERHAEANVLSNLVALCRICHLKWEWRDHRLPRLMASK